MEIRVLGPMEVHREGATVSPGGLKQRTVLALLVAARGRPVSTDALIEGVYGEDAATGARRTLATYVSNLRQLLGDDLTRSGAGYLLRADNVDIDMVTFEKLYRDAVPRSESDPGRAASMLREALALWRGHAYVDVEARSMLDGEITRLNELRLSALDARIEADLALGLHRDLVGELESLTAEHPFRESFRAQHMVALYRAGRQSEALRAFGRTRTVLAEELGIDPSPELRELEMAILSQDPKLEVRIKAAIETRAVLAAELDDSVRYLSHRQRDHALSERDRAFASAVAVAGGTQLGVRGVAVYAAFADVASALTAARSLAGGNLRLAIDHGEVETSDDGTSGPPISRALRLAAVAHPGQVLLSPDAHGRLSGERSAGWSVLSLGTFEIRGLDRPLPVFQVTGAGLSASYPELLVDRLPPPMPDRYLSGTVPGYELRTELGGGPAGAVYRAYQASVGREVAVRVIRPEVVADPRFIRRFEATAQRIAAISHPHIIELLDYWRDPGQAFLVYRLIEGGSLAEVNSPPMRIVEQVGAALASAHDAGMPHGRVRPESILVDTEGNAYLSGLGVVSILHDLVPFPADAYTAPEVIGGDATAAGDVYSLGMLAAALLAGPQPSDGAPLSITGRLGEVIARATDPDPAVRHGDVRQFVADLADTDGGAGASASGPTRNPYKGLAAFQESDADDFFGRAAVVTALIDSVRENRVTVVVGPSGIGKSSVVRAGLIPALRRGVLPGSEDWLITDMFPGSRPFDELESALARVSTRPPADEVDRLRSGRAGLIEVIQELLPEGATAVLVVDQFEELFTHLRDEETRRRFLDLLVEVHHHPDSSLRVVATLRADFFDRPLRNAAFGELIEDVLVTVSAPTTEELADIVTRPGRGVGLDLDDGLVATLVADADGETGGLPLLQHALTELFETRDGDRLTLAAYVEAGGLAGSIGRRADAIYHGLSDEDQVAAREVFVRLVTVDDNAEDTRRRARIAELDGIGVAAASVQRVLEAFGRHRLLVFDRDAATRGPTVEVAHEALIRNWDRLRAWIDERREALLTHRRVEVATRDWVASGRDPSFLVAGARLEQAETPGLGLGSRSEEVAFLVESRRVVDHARARTKRNRRRVTTALSGALALAVAFGSFGWVQRGVAEREAITARMQELAVEAEAAIDEDPDLAILLALEAYELSEQLDVERTPGEVMRALHVTTQASRLQGRLPHGAAAVAVSSDGRWLAVDDRMDARRVHVYDAATLAEVATIETDHDVGSLAFTPDARDLAVFHGAGVATVERESDVPLMSLYSASGWQFSHRSSVTGDGFHAATFSPDGRYVLVYGSDSVLIAQGDAVVLDGLARAAWVPGVDHTVVVSDFGEEGLRFIDLSTMGGVGEIATPGSSSGVVAVRPDGAAVAVTDDRGTAVYEVGGESPTERLAVVGVLNQLYSSDGRMVVAQGNDDLVLVRSPGGEDLYLRGHDGGSWAAAFDVHDQRLFVPVVNGGTLVWDLTPDGPDRLGNLAVEGSIGDAFIDPKAGTPVVLEWGDEEGRLVKLDAATGAPIGEPIPVAGGAIPYVDPDQGLFAAAALALVPGLREECERISNAGGQPLVIAIMDSCGERPVLRLVEQSTSRVVGSYEVGDNERVDFGPLGSVAEGLVVIRGTVEPVVDLVRLSDGEIIGRFQDPRVTFPFWPRFSPDGRTMVVGSQEGVFTVAKIDDLLGGASIEASTLRVQAAFGPANAGSAGVGYVASTHSGELIRLWDRDTLDLWFDIPISSLDNLVITQFTPDDRYLFYRDGNEPEVFRRLPLDPEVLAELARAGLNRDFTVEECERFLSDTDCSAYEET